MRPWPSGTIARLGDWPNRYVFRDALPGPPRDWLRVLGTALAGVLLVGLQLLRMHSSAPLNSVWAEDGSAWLNDALHRGFLHALVTPHDGYLQTLSRLVAEPVALLPVRWFAPAMALSGALIVAACVVIVWRCSAPYIETPWLRLVLCGLMILTPAAGVEMFDNVTNSIWFIQFAAFWLLLWRPPSFAAAAAAAAILLLAALSTAGVILLVPVWALRAIAIRDRRDAVMVLAPAVGVLAQVPPLLAQRYGYFDTPRWSSSLFAAYAQRVLGSGVLGNNVAGNAWRSMGVPFELLLGAGLVALVVLAMVGLSPGARCLVALMVAMSVAIFLVSGYERGIVAFLLWPAGRSNVAVGRYAICPSLLLLGAGVIALDGRMRRSGTVASHVAAVGVSLALVVLALSSFTPPDSAARGHFSWSRSVATARARCARRLVAAASLPVSPFGGLSIPCDRLR